MILRCFFQKQTGSSFSYGESVSGFSATFVRHFFVRTKHLIFVRTKSYIRTPYETKAESHEALYFKRSAAFVRMGFGLYKLPHWQITLLVSSNCRCEQCAGVAWLHCRFNQDSIFQGDLWQELVDPKQQCS